MGASRNRRRRRNRVVPGVGADRTGSRTASDGCLGSRLPERRPPRRESLQRTVLRVGSAMDASRCRRAAEDKGERQPRCRLDPRCGFESRGPRACSEGDAACACQRGEPHHRRADHRHLRRSPRSGASRMRSHLTTVVQHEFHQDRRSTDGADDARLSRHLHPVLAVRTGIRHPHGVRRVEEDEREARFMVPVWAAHELYDYPRSRQVALTPLKSSLRNLPTAIDHGKAVTAWAADQRRLRGSPDVKSHQAGVELDGRTSTGGRAGPRRPNQEDLAREWKVIHTNLAPTWGSSCGGLASAPGAPRPP
ncbi:hypothetical protein BW41_03292 [Sphingomonas sp. RIT328]|nr:hypothetical protein BW41_03292 [Sphingomonas sp. RIT328]